MAGLLSNIFFKRHQNKVSVKETLVERSSPEMDGVSASSWIMDKVNGFNDGGFRSPSLENAYTIPVVYAIIKILSEDLSSLRHSLMDRTPEGNSIINTTHHAARTISRPNPLHTDFTFDETMNAGMFARGNSYAVIHYDSRGMTYELELIPVDDIHIDYDYYTNRKKLTYHILSQNKVILPHEIIHYKGFSLNGIEGVSPISMMRPSIQEVLRAQDIELEFGDNGAMVRNVLKTPDALSEQAYKRIKESFTTTHMGPKADPTLILEEGLEFTPVSLSPQDAGLLLSRKWNIEELSRPFRLPQHLVQNLDKATYSNIEHQTLEYVKNCMRPNVRRKTAEENRKLLLGRDQTKRFFKYHLEDMIKGDMKAEADYFKTMFLNGLMTQNEIRAEKNLPPKEGGDVLMTPVSMRDRLTEKLGNNMKINNGKDGGEEE